MSEHNRINEEESLRRSHSKLSNFKLTLITMLCALSITIFTAALASFGTDILKTWILVLAAVVSGAFSALSIFLINRFKR